MNDLLNQLAALPDAEPSVTRAARIKARARRHMTPPRRRTSARPTAPTRIAPLLWLAAGVSAAILVEAVAVAADVLSARFRG